MKLGKYWSKSKENFDSLHPILKDVVLFVLDHMDIEVFYGYRTQAEQNKLFGEKKSKVTYPHSKHNKSPSQAMDLQIYEDGKATWDTEKYKQLYHLVMFYALNNELNIRWGGNWDGDNTILDDQSFDDLMHFEI